MTQKVVLVTGAGSGIGRAVALAFLKRGDAVVLAGRRREPLEMACGMAGAGCNFLAHPADVTDPDQVAGLFAATAQEFGRLDVLFNNAGTFAPPAAFEDVGPADWNRVVAVNLTGAFLCAQQAVRQMKTQTPRGGRIINNGSIAAHSPRPGSVAYTASKHAVTGLTKAIALEGRTFDIACGQIDIGNADTQMTAAMKTGVPQADGRLAPEPMMDVAAVAQAVLMMADLPLSANVPFITLMATGMPYMGRG